MYTYKIELDRVVDGDTIDAKIDLGFDISTKKRIRFMGITLFSILNISVTRRNTIIYECIKCFKYVV